MNDLGNKLKQLRESNGYTGKDVVTKLYKSGYELADKTLYNYEKGLRMPNADLFLELCKIYNCKNILETFSGVKIDYSIPDDAEWGVIEKYRSLDPHGKKTVDSLITIELERMQSEAQQPKNEIILYRFPYAADLAASAGTGEYAMDIAHFTTVSLSEEPPVGAHFLIRISGNSMEPKFSDGDKVFIKRMDAVEIDEIGLFFLDGDVYIKQMGKGNLISLNTEYDPLPIKEFSSFKCFGKVLRKCECEIVEM